VTILAALGSQYIGGLVPCELCLEQRLAYYYGLPLLLAVLVTWNRLPLAVWYIAMAIVTAIFVWGAYLGYYHAGVEWGFWPGPADCGGAAPAAAGSMADFRKQLETTRVVSCTEAAFRVLGLSMAGWNVVVSLALAGFAAAAARRPGPMPYGSSSVSQYR
jgi:disulfide bond formation protein DsbB